MLKWLDMQYLEMNCACTDWTIGILNWLFIGYFWIGTQVQSFKCYFKPYITFQILRKVHDWNNVLHDLTDGFKTSLTFPKGIFPSMSSMRSTSHTPCRILWVLRHLWTAHVPPLQLHGSLSGADQTDSSIISSDQPCIHGLYFRNAKGFTSPLSLWIATDKDP